ncbi:helix-turn-helix domain-containing protein [Mycolicibacterium neoaurum]|uniref:helix-turn-helix domain-containing protein n=1 Tax=Mycolicibacterium neoaurum TaxID=1795 RepID=UPI001F4CEB64|nr:helix-turn-helix domain-containing protein [Mycolicibacterium neoaurum]
MTEAEAAEYIGVTKGQVRRLRRAGVLPMAGTYQPPRGVVVRLLSADDVTAYANRNDLAA